jgi:hypothetical protein
MRDTFAVEFEKLTKYLIVTANIKNSVNRYEAQPQESCSHLHNRFLVSQMNAFWKDSPPSSMNELYKLPTNWFNTNFKVEVMPVRLIR